MSSQKSMLTLADLLEQAPRTGQQEDRPEGSRVVHLSDTLVKEIVSRLRVWAAEDRLGTVEQTLLRCDFVPAFGPKLPAPPPPDPGRRV